MPTIPPINQKKKSFSLFDIYLSTTLLKKRDYKIFWVPFWFYLNFFWISAPFTLSFNQPVKLIYLIFRTSNILFICVYHNKYILVFLLFIAFPEKSLLGIFYFNYLLKYKNILETLFLFIYYFFFYVTCLYKYIVFVHFFFYSRLGEINRW